MTVPSLNTLIKKSKEDHNFIRPTNLFFNPDTQMDTGILCNFLRDRDENGILFFDDPKKITHYCDQFDNNLLHMAEVSDNKQLAYWLITCVPELMYEKNRFGHYPVHFAAMNHLGLQKYPTEFFTYKAANDMNMLHISTLFGSVQNVQMLLKNTDTLYTYNLFGGPALHCATRLHSKDIASKMKQMASTKLLLSHMDEGQRKQQLRHKNAFDLSPSDYIEEFWKPAERALIAGFL